MAATTFLIDIPSLHLQPRKAGEKKKKDLSKFFGLEEDKKERARARRPSLPPTVGNVPAKIKYQVSGHF